MTRWLTGLVWTLLATAALTTSHAAEPIEYTLKLDTVMSGFDGKTCWVAPRAGVVHGPQPSIVFTMQKLLLTGSDIFFAVNEVRSDDLGKTWLPPLEHPTTLGRRQEPNGIEVVAGDMVPKWHAKTGKLLSTGPTVRYKRNAAGAEVKISQNEASSRTAYSVYDPQQRTWTAWDTIVMPDDP